MRLYQSYRRSPYSVIFSRWKKHVIRLLAFIGVLAIAYVAWGFHGH